MLRGRSTPANAKVRPCSCPQRPKLARGAKGKLETIIVSIVAMHTRLPSWVINVGLGTLRPLPQFPRKPAFVCAAISVATGQKETHAPRQTGSLFDNLSAVASSVSGIVRPSALSGLEVDYQFEQ